MILPESSPEPDAPAVISGILELLGVPSHTAAAVASSVQQAMEEDGQPQPKYAEDHFTVLCTRALSAVGEQKAAELLLGSFQQFAGWSGQVDPASLSPGISRLVASGLLRAHASDAWRGGVVALLDLRQLRQEAGLLELAAVQALHRMADLCAPLWDRAAGSGLLVARGLRQLSRSADPDPSCAGRLQEALHQRLDWLRGERGWRTAPWLVVMD